MPFPRLEPAFACRRKALIISNAIGLDTGAPPWMCTLGVFYFAHLLYILPADELWTGPQRLLPEMHVKKAANSVLVGCLHRSISLHGKLEMHEA